jgi:hypothetical protein
MVHIFSDVEYFTEDGRSYLHLFHFKLAILLSIISMKRDYLNKCIPEDADQDQSVSAAESIGPSLITFWEDATNFDEKFSHVADQSWVLNLLLLSDDTSHINKLIQISSNLCPHVYLPSHIDMESLKMFLKTNPKKIILINYSYFKWTAKNKKIFHYLMFMSKRGVINNPIWLIADTLDLKGDRVKELKTIFGWNVYEGFDICLGYDQEVTKCIGVSFNKHLKMNTLQNFRLSDSSYQQRVNSLDLQSILKSNKCNCATNDILDNFKDLNLSEVNVESLISHYYCWRKEQSEVTKVKMTPNRLSVVYKVAENVNFLRELYLKNENNLENSLGSGSSLNIVDGVIAIFLNELTCINDRSVGFSDKQLVRSFCIERVFSRMEVRPLFEQPSNDREIERKGQVFQNMNLLLSSRFNCKVKVKADIDSENVEKCQSWENLNFKLGKEKKVPLQLVDFATTYVGMIKSIFTR